MSFLQSIFKRRTTDRLAGSGQRFFFGQSDAGKVVNERTAMQMTAVYACVRILAESIASLPLHVYEKGERGYQTRAEEYPLYTLLHDEPNPEMTSFIFREVLMTHILLHGNAYAQILRNGRGEVIGLYPLLPDRMRVERDGQGQLYYRYQRYNEEPPTMEGSDVILHPAKGGQIGVIAASDKAITADEVVDLIYQLKRPYRTNAVFVTSDATLAAVRKLKDTTGQYLWQPALAEGEPDRLLGFPVYTSQFVPGIGAGESVMAFGDMRYYNIGDRGTRSFAALHELYAGVGQVAFVAKERVDGKLVLPEAVQILKMKGMAAQG